MPLPGRPNSASGAGGGGSDLDLPILYAPENISTTGLNDLLAEASSVIGAREGGAVVEIPNAAIEVNAPIEVGAHAWLRGSGAGSLLVAGATFDDSSASAVVINASDGDRRFRISDLSIDASTVNSGMVINTPDIEGDEYADGIYTVHNVEVFDAGVSSFVFQGRGQALISDLRSRDPGVNGYVIESPDSIYTNIESSAAGAAGIVLQGTNNRLIAPKSFYSGRVTPASGYGIHCDGTDGDRNSMILGGESQDNNNDGLYIDAYSRLDVLGFLSEGNNAGNYSAATQNASAFHVRAASNVRILGKAIGRASNTHQQQYAIEVESSADYLEADIHSDDNAAGHILAGSIEGLNISINGYKGFQTISYAASRTPDPTEGHKMVIGPLTGPITIANPATANYHYGHLMVIEVRQDATGGRVVTWGNHYLLPDSGITPNTGASMANIYTFMRVSSGWVLTSFIAGIDLS